MIKKIFSTTTLLSILLPLVVGVVSYLATFFITIFPNTQAEIKLLDSKYSNLGNDIYDIKETQKEFSKDQKYLIKFLLENKNVRRKNIKDD